MANHDTERKKAAEAKRKRKAALKKENAVKTSEGLRR